MKEVIFYHTPMNRFVAVFPYDVDRHGHSRALVFNNAGTYSETRVNIRDGVGQWRRMLLPEYAPLRELLPECRVLRSVNKKKLEEAVKEAAMPVFGKPPTLAHSLLQRWAKWYCEHEAADPFDPPPPSPIEETLAFLKQPHDLEALAIEILVNSGYLKV